MTGTRKVFERCMVDTNVLVYATIDEAPRCEEARQWMRRLQKQGVQLCTTPQVYREYLVVLTRGSIFERTFTVTEALAALEALRPAFRELSPTSETFTALTHLVRRYEVGESRCMTPILSPSWSRMAWMHWPPTIGATSSGSKR